MQHLIELGGLVHKSGLVEVADDDLATLYGGFLELAQRLAGEDGDAQRALLRRRGARAFATEAEEGKAARAALAAPNDIGDKP